MTKLATENTMKKILASALFTAILSALSVSAFAKLPPLSDEAKAKAERLVAALQGSLRDGEFTATLARFDYKPSSQEQATPGALEQKLKSEIAKWGPVIKNAGVKID